MPRRHFLAPTLALFASLPLAAVDSTPPAPAPAVTPTKADNLGTVVVLGTASGGYATPTVQTATRTDTTVAETPLSIQAVPAEVIQDQADVRLKDVERNVSGIAPMKTEGNGIQFETAYIRGFSQLLYIDGVQFYTMPTVDVAGVQRIDVLKGPASAMYGGMEPGGLINVVPKLPQFSSHSSVSGEAGSYDFYRGEFDSTGPISDTVAYRLEGSFQDSDSYRDFLHQRSAFIAPSLAWNPTPTTRISTWLWFQDLERPQDQGVVFTFPGQPVGPITRNLAGPNNKNTQYIDDLVYAAQIEQEVASDLKVRAKFLTHSFVGHEDAIRWNAVTAANTIAPYYDNSRFNNRQLDLITDADYHLVTGALHHEILFGAEVSRNDYHYDRVTDTALPAINIFNPVYPVGPYPTTNGLAEQHTLTDDGALYLQDQIGMLGDQLHLLAGGRADSVSQRYISFSTGNHYQQSDVGFSGRAGILYDLTSWMSPYVDVGRSFNPNTAGSNLTFAGTTLPPTKGTEYEGGMKFSSPDKRLTATTAVYQITKNDVPVADPAHTGFSVDGGEMRSRGIELDASGQILPGLQVIGNYSHTYTRVIASTTLPVGATFINIPLNSGSVWLSYTVQDGPLQDLGVGVGAFASDRKAGDGNNTFTLPGYTRFDAGAWYQFGIPSGQKVKLQLNATNLLDKTYYESSSGAGSVEPGAPFTLIGKLSLLF